MKFYKHILLFLTLMVSLTGLLQAEPVTDGSLRVVVVDKSTSETLPYVSVSLARKGEKLPSIFGLTDDSGLVLFKHVPDGTYTLMIQQMGYKTFMKEYPIKGYVHLGKIQLEPDKEMLDAASVSAQGNPMIVKKDTIEYTASSFKTSDSDMLEQLLKKLPGVEVSADGTIKANGEPVKKITIGGKTFFLDDPKLAARNIPANIVDKVKVVEKRSEQSMFTGIDDGERETVIDLKFRPGMAEGWIGNLVAAGGHDVPVKGAYTEKNQAAREGWRWNGSGMAGRYDETSQISVIVNGNNINSTAFNDMSGAQMQNMRGALQSMGTGNAGWGGGSGITTSWMGGLNGVFSLLDHRMDLGASYLYSGSDKQIEQIADKVTYLENGERLLNHNEGANGTFTQGHRIGMRLEHKFSDKASILFEPQFDFGNGHFNEFSQFNTRSMMADQPSDTLRLNEGYRSMNGRNKNWNANGYLLYRQRLGKPGRTMTLYFKYAFSGNELLGYNQSRTSVLNPEMAAQGGSGSPEDLINQRFETAKDKAHVRVRATYTEPLGKNFFFEANYAYAWNRNKSYKDAFNSGELASDAPALSYNPEGEVKDDVYSNDILQRYDNHQAGVNFSYQKDKLFAQVGVTANPTKTHYRTNAQNYDKQVVNWSPRLTFRYEFSQSSNLRLYYYGSSSQPSIHQIMPVPDNSDPLNRNFGNPYLKPWFDHSFRGKYGYTNRKTFTSVYARFRANYTQDPVVNASWYDAQGVAYTLPVQGRDKGSVSGGFMVSSPLGKGFSINNWMSLQYDNASSYIGNEKMQQESGHYFLDEQGLPTDQFNYELFHRENADIEEAGRFMLNKSQGLYFIERLRFTYRNDLVEVNLGGRTMMSKMWYTLNKEQAPRWNNQVDFSMNWTLPAGFGFITDLDYNWYNGYAQAQKPEFVLNMELSKLFFKDRMTLAIKAEDLLNQSKNLYTSDAANTHQEVWNNSLGRYIMVSLAFRFGKGNDAVRGGTQKYHPHMSRH